MYVIRYSKQAAKDIRKLEAHYLKDKAHSLIAIIKENPFTYPPPFEKMGGDFKGFYSRRINKEHRLLYTVDEQMGIVSIYRVWSHYEGLNI